MIARALILAIVCQIGPVIGFLELTEPLHFEPQMLWPKMHPEDSCSAELDCLEDEFSEEGLIRRSRRSTFVPYKTGKFVATQVSGVLDHLLYYSGYEKGMRPDVGGPPLVVTINLSIRSMGPVDENDMAFSLDCYFRQSWVDKRLQYNATGVSELALNWQFLEKIWVPDTFFVNGRKSYLHKITVPNRFVRIYPNGRVSYSQRLTIWAECAMHLHKFPLDTQMCPLNIGSFGYDANDIVYNWAEPRSVSIDKLGLAQFHLMNYKSFTEIKLSSRRTRIGFRNDSTACLEFNFERQTGFFLLQIYTPLILIVFCSWVAFWLIKTDKGGEVPARTVLGANSVLSIVNIGFGGKSRPPVGYATALDIFIILCFVSVFAALLEFACINFLDLFIARIKKREEEKAALLDASLLEQETKEPEVVTKLLLAAIPVADATVTVDFVDKEEPDPTNEAPLVDGDNLDIIEVIGGGAGMGEDEEFEEIPEEEEPVLLSFHDKIAQAFQRFCDRMEQKFEARYGPITETYVYNNTTEVIWHIDESARIYFPGVFLVLQLIYWISYLYLM